jgi:GNAT superfamily N-acetyltransferase
MSSRTAGTDVVADGTRLRLVSTAGFVVDATTSAKDGLLKEFYSDYDRAFVLENEKEGYDGFVECFKLNHGNAYTALVKRYGPFREFVMVVRAPKSDARLAGANFIIFPVPPAGKRGVVLSMNLNYVFVNPEARRKGVFRRLMGDLPQIAYRLFAQSNPRDVPEQRRVKARKNKFQPQVYMFIEQNDPFRMSAGDYDRDTRLTGLDQVARIGLWSRLGAKIVDFPYVQPPLSKDQDADETLAYAVLGAPGKALDADLLRSHLERFFGISVLKGADLSAEPAARAQLSELTKAGKRNQRVPLLAGKISTIKSKMANHSARRPATLRDALRKPNS